jgi:hypothetical protein
MNAENPVLFPPKLFMEKGVDPRATGYLSNLNSITHMCT